MDFTVSGITYDGNGNITGMDQRGMKINTPVTIDSLTYTYVANSNRLAKIKDDIADTDPWGDFKDTSLTTNDYVFDDNGNIVKDNNKHIHTSSNANGIAYNFLDKASSITVNGKGNISYVYSAGGMLLQKTVTDDKQNIKTVITYSTGFVYQKVLPKSGNAATVPDTLQYVLHEEGRIRNAMQVNMQTGAVSFSLVYDYFIKDHLGNIRNVITEEQRTDAYPVASLETAQLNNEKIYYSNLDAGRTDKTTVAGYPNDTYTNPNTWTQKLNGNGVRIGASMLLKVMAGDKLTVRVNSWYSSAASPNSPVNPLADIVNALTNSIPLVSGDKIVQSQLTTSVLNPSVTGFLNTRDAGGVGTKPKAWFNIVLLDEQLNPVITNDGKNSFFEQVGSSGTLKQHTSVVDRPITKSGYVYIYVSNETPNIDVFFDNLHVTHIRGPLLQEQAYYPFGLEMKGISSSAATVTANNYKFNSGTELNDNFDINYYETYFRNYDAQIGRFTGVDALAEYTYGITPYQFGLNDPIFWNDPTGALSQAEFANIINALWNTSDGGTWSATGVGGGSGGGFSYGGGFLSAFEGPDEAFFAGVNHVEQNGGWGTDGSVSSYETASNNFFNAFCYVPLRPIIVKAHNEWDVYGNAYVNVSDWKDVKYQMIQNGYIFGKNDGGIMQSAFAASGALLLDDGTGIGIADDAAIPFILAGAATVAAVRTLTRPTTQYALIARTSGSYPVYTRGSLIPTGTVQLNAGDVWKYGVTSQFVSGTNNQWRYSQAQLNLLNVDFRNQYEGTRAQALAMEQSKILLYIYNNGQLPPGNKIIR